MFPPPPESLEPPLRGAEPDDESSDPPHAARASAEASATSVPSKGLRVIRYVTFFIQFVGYVNGIVHKPDPVYTFGVSRRLRG